MKQKMVFAGIAFAIALCLVSCGGNSKYDNNIYAPDGSSENVPNDYSEELVRLAEEGNAIAQNNLGGIYAHGKGVAQSYSEAVKWYKKAAEQGYSYAQNNLGQCYNEGNGVNQSYVEAVKWYRKAAAQGNLTAQHNLGFMYLVGNGVEQSYAEAVKWYKKSAVEGFAPSQYDLGICYLYGMGVSKSLSDAQDWLDKAANQGYAKAQVAMGEIYYDNKNYDDAMGRFVQAAMQGDEEGIKAMNTWIREFAEQGNPTAQCAMGFYCKQNGKIEDAIQWFTLSSQQGNKPATEELNKMK